MYRQLTILLFLLYAAPLQAQNIFSALHLNENRAYKYGKPIQIITANTFYNSSGKQVDKSIKYFDNSGMLTTEERYDKEGQLNAKLTYKNDTVRGLILESKIERWASFGYLKDSTVYSYNEQGVLTRITNVDVSGNIIQMADLVNNENGHPVELRLFDRKGTSYGKETAEYFYDKNRAITSVYSNDGRLLTSGTIKIDFKVQDTTGGRNATYNEKGDALTYVSQNPNGSETLYEVEYEYDSKGNWIDEKIYKVTIKPNGQKKRKLDRHFVKEIIYRND